MVQSKTAWDDFFSQASEGCWVMVNMKDGDIIGGRFTKNSYASAYPNPGHIYIEELWDVSKDKTFDAPIVGSSGVILRPDDYDYLWVYKEQSSGQTK